MRTQLLIGLLVLSSLVSAASGNPGGGGGGGGGGGPSEIGFADMETVCSELDYLQAVAQFKLVDGQFVLTDGASEATLSGPIGNMVWTSPVYVNAYVLGYYEEGQQFLSFAGFSRPRLTDDIDSGRDIRVVTLCSNEPVEVPEFGALAVIVVLVAGAAVVVARHS